MFSFTEYGLNVAARPFHSLFVGGGASTAPTQNKIYLRQSIKAMITVATNLEQRYLDQRLCSLPNPMRENTSRCLQY